MMPNVSFSLERRRCDVAGTAKVPRNQARKGEGVYALGPTWIIEVA